MSLKYTLGSLALAASLAALASGCVVRAHGQVGAPVAYVEVQEEPPPPRVVVYETRPGFIWVDGRWDRRGNRWVWRDGFWERNRNGQVWEQGRWERRGRGHVYVSGRWRASGGSSNPPPAVNGNGRDRRDNRGRGTNVRDHRR
jgi:WXXGXW repeat (2 copies)